MTGKNQIRILAEKLVADFRQGKKAGCLTGAGVSVESGIPDFRSPHGLWERFDIMEYGTIDAFLQDPIKVWKMLSEVDQLVCQAKPNPAHIGLARLEQLGILSGIITQNIDNLHQAAGSQNVIEYHGNTQRLICLQCKSSIDAESVRSKCDQSYPPQCPSCSAILKPDVVLFGEAIPEDAGNQAFELCQDISTLLIVGTSAQVVPASYLPMLAKKAGAILVEINVDKTVLTDSYIDISLLGKAGQVVSALMEQVELCMSI
jgi:NAD-dependent deacetylase